MNLKKQNKNRYYKGKYIIVFYDVDDETYLREFNNVEEILTFRGEIITYTNKNMMNVELYRALRRKGNFTRMLGYPARVYIIDMEDKGE